VMRDVLLDVLRALAAPNSDIRRKTLDLALDLIDSRCARGAGAGLRRGTMGVPASLRSPLHCFAAPACPAALALCP
jgi:hypothetical protein